jgi:hypothetical protein
MTSIYDVPYEDIQKFLLANKKTYINEIDAYNKALILLKDKKSVGHTISIIEWMIAHNLLKKKINIPNFTIYQIDNMKQFEIDELAKLLTMNSNNIENIKNILRYMGKLDILIEHPDIKPLILGTILELKVLSSNLEEVITIFKNNKFLRKFIYDNMNKIISNNIVYKENTNEITKESAIKLAKFIFDLIKLNEFTLVKEAIRSEFIKKIRKYDINNKIIKYLNINVLTSLNVDLMIKYFGLFDYINSIHKNSINDYSIKNVLINPEGELKQMKFYPSIFRAALITEKMEILQAIYHFWWFESAKITKYNKDFLKQMEPLIKEFEDRYPDSKYTL